MKQFRDLGIAKSAGSRFIGNSIEIHKILNTPIIVEHYEIRDSKFKEKGNGKCLYIQIKIDDAPRVIFTGSGALMDTIEKVPAGDMPFETKIVKENSRYEFT